MDRQQQAKKKTSGLADKTVGKKSQKKRKKTKAKQDVTTGTKISGNGVSGGYKSTSSPDDNDSGRRQRKLSNQEEIKLKPVVASYHLSERTPTVCSVESQSSSGSSCIENKQTANLQKLQLSKPSSNQRRSSKSGISSSQRKVGLLNEETNTASAGFSSKIYQKVPETVTERAEGKVNESLRWSNVLPDAEEEEARLKLYKINRRKRYLAAKMSQDENW